MKKLVLGLVLWVFGVVLAFGGGRMVYRAWASERWPVVRGSVLSSSVETLRSRRSVSFRPHVRYSYTVGTEHFTSETIAFAALDTGNSQEANDYVRRFPAGAPVELRYSPEHPSIACIECGHAGLADYVVTVGGGLLALYAAWGLLELLRSGLRARRRQRPIPSGGAAPPQAARG
ncbi:DUF3592 domain-containing protein [Archangium lansingense]|uniref:DUF3592 domain-containing protein n=1 Tax=Archangium lansingense TaxID=2995310 RepID=A0ABT4AJU9_9BACT|nr:DUF3592 domain-containing protein [Archangium lansinium]MCY1081950.1 DUF3592 domain-containing protein [Archangium lansinium]